MVSNCLRAALAVVPRIRAIHSNADASPSSPRAPHSTARANARALPASHTVAARANASAKRAHLSPGTNAGSNAATSAHTSSINETNRRTRTSTQRLPTGLPAGLPTAVPRGSRHHRIEHMFVRIEEEFFRCRARATTLGRIASCRCGRRGIARPSIGSGGRPSPVTTPSRSSTASGSSSSCLRPAGWPSTSARARAASRAPFELAVTRSSRSKARRPWPGPTAGAVARS